MPKVPRDFRSRVQNQRFEQDSVKSPSWVRIVKDTYPHLRPCAGSCGKKLVVDDIAVTIPLIHGNELVGTVVLHAKCLREHLESVPEEIDVVRGRWHKIRDKHTAKSSKNGSA